MTSTSCWPPTKDKTFDVEVFFFLILFFEGGLSRPFNSHVTPFAKLLVIGASFYKADDCPALNQKVVTRKQ